MNIEEYTETCFRSRNFIVFHSKEHSYYHILNRSSEVSLDRMDIETESELRELLELIQHALDSETR